MAAIPGLGGLYQPAQPDAQGRPARLPGRLALSGPQPAGRQGDPPGEHDHGPPGRPLRLRLAALRGLREQDETRGQGAATSPGTLQGTDRAAGRGNPPCHPRQGKAVLRAGRRGDRLRLPAQQVGDSRTHQRGYSNAPRGDLGKHRGTGECVGPQDEHRGRSGVFSSRATHREADSAGYRHGRRDPPGPRGDRGRHEPVAARAPPGEGRPRCVPGLQPEPPGQSTAVHASAPGPAACRSAGTPCATRSREFRS